MSKNTLNVQKNYVKILVIENKSVNLQPHLEIKRREIIKNS